MSQSYNPYVARGLVVQGNALETFIERKTTELALKDNENYSKALSGYDIAEYDDRIDYYDGDETYVSGVIHNLNGDFEDTSFGEPILVISGQKRLGDGVEHMEPYKSAKEMINELKADYGKFLPDDFDYAANAGIVALVLYG